MKIDRILIAIDNNIFSEHAAEYGFDIARKFGAQVGLVHIIEPIVFPTGSADTLTAAPFETTPVSDPELISIQTESSENVITAIVRKFGDGLEVKQFTEYGPTAQGILDCSREFKADMIVTGTHSRSGLERLLMGSVAEHIVRHSEVPVLVVPLREWSEI